MNYENKTFGKWTVVKDLGIRKVGNNRRHFMLCKCSCGNTNEVLLQNLKSGKSIKCYNCKQNDFKSVNVTHGLSKTSEFRAWQSLLQRCGNPKCARYNLYGGRGIKVCDRWLNSFENFYKDMGKKPSPKHSIDRINNDGNYEPGNCRWATYKQQNENRKKRK